MSILKSKHSGWLADGTRTPFGDGGGGGGPTQSTTVTSNIPEYARPYVTNMLEAAQRESFTGTTTPEGGFNITGFKPYTPYSADVNDYFAGFSPLQRQAQIDAGAMQQPGQFALGSGLAGSAGIQSIRAAQGAGALGQDALGYGRRAADFGELAHGLSGSAQAYGKRAADFGELAHGLAGRGFNAGDQFAQNVTSPASMQAYMSPYQQGVTDVAKNAAVREAQMAQQAQNLGAARQGTYGGARQTLAGMERERNLLSNLSNIQTQGSQAAYDRAMQTQQFGANLGLQGVQTGYGALGMGIQGQQAGMAGAGQAGQLLGQGIQGQQAGMQGVQSAIGAGQFGLQGLGQALGAGSQLAQIGATQQGTDIARQNQMSAMGGQQQLLEQNKINQAIQDYATQRQNPQMQLGFLSNMLRGLPMQAQTTQGYQSAPSTVSQIAGLGTAGIGAFGLGKAAGVFAEGGQVNQSDSMQMANNGLGGLSLANFMGKS